MHSSNSDLFPYVKTTMFCFTMETIPGTRTGVIKSRQCIIDEVFELTMRQQFSSDNGHVETSRVVEMCIVAIEFRSL